MCKNNNKQKNIYIMISKTDTFLGTIIQTRLKTRYNHCSIALDDDLNTFYSFGRKEVYNFIRAGFVHESKDYGFFKVFNNSKICLIKLRISNVQYEEVKSIINTFKKNKNLYKFNITGLFLSGLNICYAKKNHYFCSQFVSQVLKDAGIYDFGKDCRLVKPHEFLNIPEKVVVYRGVIKEYTADVKYTENSLVV